jgi:hypothetical protein
MDEIGLGCDRVTEDGSHAMVSIEEYSRLVSGIYTAAVAPQYWEQALRELHRTLGGISAALCIPTGPVWSIENSNLPEDAARSYAEYYNRLDIVLDAVQAGPVGEVRTGSELIAPVHNTEFYTGWMKPNRLEDGLFVRLTPGTQPTCLVVASPGRSTRRNGSRCSVNWSRTCSRPCASRTRSPS